MNIKIFPLLFVSGMLGAQPVIETVFYDMPQALEPNPIPAPTATLLAVAGYPNDPARMTFIARLYLPDPAVHGPGPYPVVLFLHGSGGLWANSLSIPNPLTAANAPSSQFREWGNRLVDEGYACLFPDSLHVRGIAGSFEGRRPHHDPAQDDAACSPNYERPKDVVAALTYLGGRPDIDRERVALIGFSHGAQTGMNALLDVSVDRGVYDVDYIDLVEQPPGSGVFVEQSVKRVVPGPVRIPDDLPFPRFCAFFYGGGGHFSYHGSPSSTQAGRYMMDRRTQAILFHGIGDSLLGVSDPLSSPMTGTFYPAKQVLASEAQAASLGLPNPIVRHYLMDRTVVHQPANARVGHSFDLGSVGFADPADWDTALETPNQKARRMAREAVLAWLAHTFEPEETLELSLPGGNQLRARWPGHARLSYRLEGTDNLLSPWSELLAWVPGNGGMFEVDNPYVQPGNLFLRFERKATPLPVDAPEHAGFFRTYAELGL